MLSRPRIPPHNILPVIILKYKIRHIGERPWNRMGIIIQINIFILIHQSQFSILRPINIRIAIVVHSKYDCICPLIHGHHLRLHSNHFPGKRTIILYNRFSGFRLLRSDQNDTTRCLRTINGSRSIFQKVDGFNIFRIQ